MRHSLLLCGVGCFVSAGLFAGVCSSFSGEDDTPGATTMVEGGAEPEASGDAFDAFDPSGPCGMAGGPSAKANAAVVVGDDVYIIGGQNYPAGLRA